MSKEGKVRAEGLAVSSLPLKAFVPLPQLEKEMRQKMQQSLKLYFLLQIEQWLWACVGQQGAGQVQWQLWAAGGRAGLVTAVGSVWDSVWGSQVQWQLWAWGAVGRQDRSSGSCGQHVRQ